MARTNSNKTETPAPESPAVLDLETSDSQSTSQDKAIEETEKTIEVEEAEVEEAQDVDSILNSLKTLLTTVEKLQKVRQEVGDIKPLLVRMLDGELVSGEDLEQLKTGVGGLLRLVRAYSDHQAALTKAQPARSLLDEVLKVQRSS
jgi:Fic family protein